MNINSQDHQLQHLTSEISYRTRLQEICNRINAAANLDEILINLKDDITSLFEAERITVYVVDPKRRELVSRFKSGKEIAEIRIPLSTSSIAGWCAIKNTTINIKDAYDQKELVSIDPDLKFDERWDPKTGFTTRQILARPIVFKNSLLGVIQLINRKTGTSFVQIDEQSLAEVAHILGIALHNQKKLSQKHAGGKFDFLIENQLLTHLELDQAMVTAGQKHIPLESVLMSDMKISKKDILSSLEQFYNTDSSGICF